jgi:5-methylcytosine-specific restriction enzyme subunit McrC
MKQNNPIQVFEFDKLKLSNNTISETCLKTLQTHYGEKGVPYYNLIHNGVSFNNYVGVIQVNDITIEILPKIDKLENIGKSEWRNHLISLLHYTGEIEVDATEMANLKMNKLSLLELYFSMFIKEVNYLIHRGLVKKYRKTEGNLYSLKGSLQFSKNISQNLVHAERFYTRHTVYDRQHLPHQILQEAMYVINTVSNSSTIKSAIAKLILDFPEQEKLKITEHTFSKIKLDRKTEPYKKALNIAKMILLNYHPDINKGGNNVLALFFDMNLLWEKYVAKVLRTYLPNSYEIATQNKALFWESSVVPDANIKPDILIKKGKDVIAILDTKWKLPYDYRPKDDDLKQMFSYNKIFKGTQSWLLYPNDVENKKEGLFVDGHGGCGMMMNTVLFYGYINHKKLALQIIRNLKLFPFNEEVIVEEVKNYDIE